LINSNIKRLEILPDRLKQLKKPVEKLYFRGNRALLKEKKISIVGSRKMLAYTKQMVASLSMKLSQNNIVIVSGGAMGVDAIAHKAAYPNTIAVMANGLDIVYPQVNKEIINNIYTNALALSEYEKGVRATRYSFVVRNRIVVGLSDIVIIAQADLNSGTMQSAKIAIEEGKEIYVLPHRMGESEGTDWLIQNHKAKVIYDIDTFVHKLTGESIRYDDPFLAYCAKTPSYDEAVAYDSAKVFEYELLGKIKVEEGRVYLGHS
jgi:DNA processing protein